jgi:hypothetical protein
MSTGLKSGCNLNFRLREHGAEKNGLRICPINNDRASVNTLGTPKISHLTGRSRRHDA